MDPSCLVIVCVVCAMHPDRHLTPTIGLAPRRLRVVDPSSSFIARYCTARISLVEQLVLIFFPLSSVNNKSAGQYPTAQQARPL